MDITRHRAVGEYLRRLQRAMRDLPAERRDEILTEIEEHITERIAETPEQTDADGRNVLERVGDPDDIAAEARERFGSAPAQYRQPSQRRKWLIGAVLALVVVVPVIAALVVLLLAQL